MACPSIPWLEKRNLITDFQDVIIPCPKNVQATMGLLNDHGFYSQVPDRKVQTSSLAAKSRRKRISKSKLSEPPPKLDALSQSADVKPFLTTSEHFINNVIESEIVVSTTQDDFETEQEAKWRVKQLRAQKQVQECDTCLKKFKRWNTYEKHMQANTCKKKKTVQDQMRKRRQKKSGILNQIENIQPSPDSEVANISRKLEAREAILNAKCPSTLAQDDSFYSPSTNSVFSTPEKDLKPQSAKSMIVKTEESCPLEFASGPPPKEARVTTPKKAIKLPEMSLNSPEKSPNIFASADEKSAFNPFSEISSLSGTGSKRKASPDEQRQSPRPPKRKPSHPYPILNLNPSIAVKKPLLLTTTLGDTKSSSGQVVFKTVTVQDGSADPTVQNGFLANVGGTQLFLIPKSSIGNGTAASGILPPNTSKLEQILRHGSAAVKSKTEEEEEDIKDTSEDDDDEEIQGQERHLPYQGAARVQPATLV